jgi:hypothetical protein
MTFQKGHPSYVQHWKGKSYEEIFGVEKAKQMKEKMSLAKRGKRLSLSTEFKKGQISWNKGTKGLTLNTGRTHFKKGNVSPNYVDGRSLISHSHEYGKDWHKIRKKVYARDNYRCVDCASKPKILHAHHLIPFKISKDNSLENLITVCASCHKKREYPLIQIQKEVFR